MILARMPPGEAMHYLHRRFDRPTQMILLPAGPNLFLARPDHTSPYTLHTVEDFPCLLSQIVGGLAPASPRRASPSRAPSPRAAALPLSTLLEDLGLHL